jgi:hypothetical protein
VHNNNTKETEMTDELYCTENLDVAAFIAARRNRRWTEWRRQPAPRKFVAFYFDHPTDARQLAREYHNSGHIVARDFVQWRTEAVQCKFAQDDAGF